MHGYEIADSIQRTWEDVLQVEEGRVGHRTGNRRARYYQLTATVRKQLAGEISQFERVVGTITRVIQKAMEAKP
jgi:PadR family transcriptional regulator PadR